MNYAEQYRRRANECFAFAKSARNEEERMQLLIMANTLERLALAREQKAVFAAIDRSVTRRHYLD
jgi:hypothetical protein